MGIRNRERRRTNKQRREARNQVRAAKFAAEYTWGGATGQQTDPSPYLVDMMLLDAAHASCEGRDPGPVLAELTDRGAGPAWCALVTARVATALVDPLIAALRSGWEPRDISAVLRRKVASRRPTSWPPFLPEALRSHRPDTVRGARWEAQVSELAPDARRLATASPTWEADICTRVTALGLLSHLGALPELTSPTQRPAPRPDLDPSLLDKVRALLAKAEATAFEEESDAFLSKAQELMTRHNLDRAVLLEAGQGGGPASRPAVAGWTTPISSKKASCSPLSPEPTGAARCHCTSTGSSRSSGTPTTSAPPRCCSPLFWYMPPSRWHCRHAPVRPWPPLPGRATGDASPEGTVPERQAPEIWPLSAGNAMPAGLPTAGRSSSRTPAA